MSLTNLTLTEIQAGLASGQFTSSELTRASLKLAEDSSELGCFITLPSEKALKDAESADARLKAGERSPLLGVPVGIKDAIVTKGIRTTSASKILSNFIPPYDATVIHKLKEAGAVILGKLNLDEFAMGSSNENSSFGVVRNPWNPEYVPGGSSGGSAAAVAAKICTITLGSDTGGSIRQPAAFCGVVGVKPTYGRVSRYGLIAFASSLDQIGPFGRSVRECAETLSVISGHDLNDGTSSKIAVPDFSKALGRGVKGLKIGVPKEYFIEGIDREVLQSVRNVITKLSELGAEIVEISLPHTELALAVYYVLAPAEASSNLARFDGVKYGFRASEAKDLQSMYVQSRSQGFGPEVQRRILLGSYVLSSGYFEAYYLQAQKVRSLVAQDFAKVFASECDLIVAPTTPTAPFKIGENTSDPLKMYLNDIFTIPVNLAGLPGMSMPCGVTESGLPIGFQLIAKAFDEETMLACAAAYESATQSDKISANYKPAAK